MKSVAANAGALGAGLLSSALTVALITAIDRALSFNLFSLTVWFVLPIGAFATGGLAAMGYYFGAVKFNAKPTRGMALGMAVVAGLTQIALYYSRYSLDTLSDGRTVHDLVDFPTYVKFILTHVRYAMAPHGVTIGEGVELGAMGYVAAVVQFLGLLVGGLAVWAILADRPYCDVCGRYAHSTTKRECGLGGQDAQAPLAQLRAIEPLSAEYFAWLDVPDRGGTAMLELEIFECRTCGRRAAVEHPKVIGADGKPSYVGDAYRTVWSTAGRAVGERVAA